MGESENGSRRPSQDSETPPMPTFSSKTFKRKKHAAPEPPKPEIDLATALPPQDDFRTSLLMPNLSARFSMLREQDDPTSMLGKANDDSVLFPKRASRLDLFNRHGLSDIAEVDSIHGSIRPPFVSNRTESYGSGGYDTDEGSVMSRARPGEGNTMFGGRQKIYKIPVGGSGSVKNFGTTEEGEMPSGGNMGGKALYESDIAMSAFQRLREQEWQERETAGLDSQSSFKEQERSGSPPLARYNRNRETSSSTNSGPSQPRTSTAATSVASQRSAYEAINGSFHAQSSTQPGSAVSDRPLQKTKRLYGQGLDQHMHEQQSSALSRLESIQRQRTLGGGSTPKDLAHTRRQSRSASNLNERYQRGDPLYVSNGFRAASPAPSGTQPRMAEFDLGFSNGQAGNTSDSGNGKSPPLSPPLSPDQDLNQDPTFVASLEPNDLGKATASGAFNKPTKQYDEQQYLRRQLQLQEGRNTPSPQFFRPFSPQTPSIDEQTTGRSRNNSLGSNFSSNFSRTGSFRQPWEHHMEDRVLPAVRERGNTPSLHESEEPNQGAMERSFFAGSEVGSQAESESEVDPGSPITSDPKLSNSSPPASQPLKPVDSNRQLYFPHDPNHLAEPTEEASSDSRSYRSEKTITQPRNNSVPGQQPAKAVDADSPTLGPVGVSNGLSGLVRAHLRNDSGQSSVYPDDENQKSRFSVEVRDSIFGHESALGHSRQQSRDDHESNRAYWANENRNSDQSVVAAPPPLSFAAKHILEQAQALRNNQENYKARQMLGDDKAQRVLGGEAPRASHSRKNSNSNNDWQAQLNAHHTRALSSETQHEREDLANELAERRRMVQDSLKNYAEVDGRSASPSPGTRTQDNSPAKSGHPFGILKKSSRGSLVVGRDRPSKSQERPSKAMKMLGISSSNGAVPSSNTHLPQPPPDLFLGREQFSDRAMPPRQKYPPQQRRPQDVRQYSDHPSNFVPHEAGSERSLDNPAQKHSPQSSKSGSTYSDRSSRPSESHSGNVMKSSLDRGRVHGYAPNGANPEPESQSLVSPLRPTDELMASIARHGLPPTERSRSAMSGRIRSNSKTEYQRTAPPNTPFMINPALRPSASPYPYSAHSTPSLHDGRLPSLSSQTSSTPTMITPQSAPNTGYGGNHSSRKRSINKHDISEPTFISCTSSVDTISLPPEASLRNGMDSSASETEAPPIPVRDSRRKRTQTLLQALGRTEKSQLSPTKRNFAPNPSPREDDENELKSTFSGDEGPNSNSRSLRQRLRKTSSEGGSMSAKVRQQIFESKSPITANPPGTEVQSPRMEHFPYQAQKDVPASAVMF